MQLPIVGSDTFGMPPHTKLRSRSQSSRPDAGRGHEPAVTEMSGAHAGDDSTQAPDRTTAERERSWTPPAPRTSEPILVVDDDPDVRAFVVSILADAGHDVCAVGSAYEARRVLARDPIALLLSEVSMPGETGLDLLRFVTHEHPATATLLISARDDPGIAQAAIDFGACGYLTKPVNRSAILIGVLNALRQRAGRAREQAARTDLECTVDLRTLALSQALGRLEEATRHGRVMQAEMIHRWAQSAEFREPGIGGHLERVSRYCGLMADKLGLHAQSLELASVLHDVGKVAIPDRIVLKRGPLTVDERLAIQTHAEIGHQMLNGSSSNILGLAAVIARTHHEKFDGGGYPHGLAGSDIPLEGRIAAVADVFDALTNDRVYRRAWSVQSAMKWMTRERDKHFDPRVLDALVSSLDEIMTVTSSPDNTHLTWH